MSENWQTKSVTLSYWLGELRLFQKSFLLQMVNADFINISPEDAADLIPQTIDETAVGHMVYSVPLKDDHKIIWRDGGYINYISQSFRRFYIDLSGSFDDYLMQFSSKTRSTFRRKVKKFQKAGGGEIDFRIYASPEELKQFHSIARKVSEGTYQEKLLDAGLPSDADFLDDMRHKSTLDKVRGFILFLNEKPVSYLYTPIENGLAQYNYVGYLPEVTRLSAGTVLLLKALEYLFENDIADYFDFTEGQSAQKEHYSTNFVYCGNKICLRYNMGHLLWLWLHRTLTTFSTFLVKGLDKLGIKAFIKKLMRRQSGNA